MATTTRMTAREHTEIFQAMSESVVADPETPTEDDVDPRALRGALYLDEHHPGWADKINLDIFSIQDVDKCVVGQVAGCYDEHAHRLFPGVQDGYTKEAEDFGILPTNNTDELNRSWKLLIAERQTGGDAD